VSISPCPLSRPLSTIPDITTSVRRRICEQPVRQPRLLHPCLGRFGEHNARAIDLMVGTTTAMSLHGVCCLGASPGFCLIAIWRRTARERQGAVRQPLDSRIKAQGGAAVGRERFQKLGARYWFARTLQESEFSFALKKSAQCAKGTERRLGVSAHMIGTVSRHQRLARRPDHPAPIKARGSRARLRRLTALTSAGWPGV
jgi:hypothetical protein